MREVLTAMIKAHEIQGCIALENSFNKVGLDHVVLVKVASTAVVCQLLGLTRDQTINALSYAWVDGQSLRTYRHAPNTGSRKSWAAGDATSRAVRLALMARAGEMGYPSALTAKTWGFYDVSFRGQEFKFQRPYGSLCDGERALQNQLSGRVSCANRRGSGDEAARAAGRSRQDRRGHSRKSPSAPTRPACASSTRRARSRTPPTATIACNTWLPFRCSSARLTAADYEDVGRQPIRASMRCAQRSNASRSRAFTPITTIRKSGPSPNACAWN